MTFTILAVSRETGEHGFAQSTSTPAVGDRVAAVVHQRGVLTVQAAGDFNVLDLGKRMMAAGYGPQKILADLAAHPGFEGRQIAVVDVTGRVAAATGSSAWGWAGEITGDDYVATGNSLVGAEVVDAMSKAYLASEGQDFAERLVLALEAGRDAGGQPDGQTSSQVQVFDPRQATLNLRVDLHPEPIGQLRVLHDWYKALRPRYVAYGLDPSSYDLDSWGALVAAGAPLFPSGITLSQDVIDDRIQGLHDLAAATAEAEQSAS